MAGELAQLIASAAQRYGQNPDTLLRIGKIESGLNPNARNPRSSAGGFLQFIDSTAKQYGLTNKFDPAMASDAGARLLRDNSNYLSSRLGRQPTGAELYLAHQQGPGGAAKILSNPAGDAASTVGAKAVQLNGGRVGMTNADFANIWKSKFDKTPGADGSAPVSGNTTFVNNVMPYGAPVVNMADTGIALPAPLLLGQQMAGNVLQADAMRVAQQFDQRQETDKQDERARKRALYGGGALASLYG